MTIFSQSRDDGAGKASARTTGREASLSIIAAGTRIVGEIESDGVVKIEGQVVGGIRAARQVLVAKGGTVEGDIMTREAIVGGNVEGSVLADERVEIQSTSSVHGDITTQRIVVQEGGEVNGTVRMANPNALAAPNPSLKNPSRAVTGPQPQGQGREPGAVESLPAAAEQGAGR